jgi:lantibiotic modifying enzyme
LLDKFVKKYWRRNMKIIKDEIATLKRKRRVVLELDHDEEYAVLKNNAYYRLGGQVDDIVQSHVIGDMSRVYWCSITQKWEEA